MNYLKIDPNDIANGEGVRVSLWVSGCTHHCKGCFNEETWDFDKGKEYTNETIEEIIELVRKPYIKGLSILGGDPMCQKAFDLAKLASLADEVHSYDKTVWLWTGYNWENILQFSPMKFLAERCDVIVDGVYIEAQRDISLPYRGSSNQRVIDVQKSLKENKVVLYETK